VEPQGERENFELSRISIYRGSIYQGDFFLTAIYKGSQQQKQRLLDAFLNTDLMQLKDTIF